jgi:hypothetical protein
VACYKVRICRVLWAARLRLELWPARQEPVDATVLEDAWLQIKFEFFSIPSTSNPYVVFHSNSRVGNPYIQEKFILIPVSPNTYLLISPRAPWKIVTCNGFQNLDLPLIHCHFLGEGTRTKWDVAALKWFDQQKWSMYADKIQIDDNIRCFLDVFFLHHKAICAIIFHMFLPDVFQVYP